MLELRPATPDDIPALRGLAEDIWRAYYPGIITHEQIEYMLARMFAPEVIRAQLESGTAWVLALAGVEPAGFLSFGFDRARREVKLHKLYLLPRFHGRGLGRQMLDQVRSEAVRLGAEVIRLQVNKRNARAMRAYERAGYRNAGAVVADIGGGFVMDDFILELAVGRPGGSPG